MMRQIREAMVRAMGAKMQAKRPAFPMMAVVGGRGGGGDVASVEVLEVDGSFVVVQAKTKVVS